MAPQRELGAGSNCTIAGSASGTTRSLQVIQRKYPPTFTPHLSLCRCPWNVRAAKRLMYKINERAELLVVSSTESGEEEDDEGGEADAFAKAANAEGGGGACPTPNAAPKPKIPTPSSAGYQKTNAAIASFAQTASKLAGAFDQSATPTTCPPHSYKPLSNTGQICTFYCERCLDTKKIDTNTI